MKRPWHYWSVFLTALALVLTAMTWLTHMALELDQAEITARQRAELEEDISRALWRMEVKLMPILAKEAARPASAYQPIQPTAAVASSNDGEAQELAPDAESSSPPAPESSSPWAAELSPLLTARPDVVLLNFEVCPSNRWTSPQSLTGQVCEVACLNGASREEIEECTRRLDELKGTVAYKSLFDSLPQDPLRQDALPTGVAAGDDAGAPPRAGELGVFANNSLDFNPLQQRALEESRPNASPNQPAQGPAMAYANPRDPALFRNDLPQRAAALQSYSQRQVIERESSDAPAQAAREGVSRPVWVGSQLLFARRVETADEVRIQGCVLNWPAIKQQLLDEVRDLLPHVDIEPVLQLEQVNVSRMLAALPAQLVVAAPVAPRVAWSPMRVSLLIVWICLLVVFAGAGVLLHGVLLLSERRGAFVSAVTHELRTPLTTFRMYSEMLARDMVPDPERRRAYLETLRVEADRLSHLVENVLSYARLERGPVGRRRQRLTVDELLSRLTERLSERAEQAGMRFELDLAASDRNAWLETDPGAVEQILFNLVDNACKYAATASDHRVRLEVHTRGDALRLAIRDYGQGISPRDARKLFRPFSKAVGEAADATPGVGLGLALCRRLARELGGRLDYAAGQESGATFILELPVEVAGGSG